MTIKFSARKVIIASVFFAAACSLLYLQPQNYNYTLILLLSIPLLILSPVSLFDFETKTNDKRQMVGILITFGFSPIIFHLDKNNILGTLTGVTNEMLTSTGWQHVLGVSLNCFISLFYIVGVTVLSNSEIKEDKQVVLN